MRKFLTIIAVLFSTVTFGQNVGISDDASFIPSYRLHVDGDIRVGETNGSVNDIYISNRIYDWDNLSYYLDPGSTSRVNEINFTDGSKSDVSIWFDGDSNTGFYQPSNGSIGISINGSSATTDAIRITSARDVGIGIESPGARLDVVEPGTGNTGLASEITAVTSGYNANEGIINYNSTTFIPSGIYGLSFNSSTLTISTSGVLGHSNNYSSDGVVGSRSNNGAGDFGFGGIFIADLGYTGFFGNVSDINLKKDICDIDRSLDIILQLEPKVYYYDIKKYPYLGLSDRQEFGFIAQDVQEILPTLVKTKKLRVNATKEHDGKSPMVSDTEEFLMMDYTRLIPILTQAIKEQQKIIDLLEDRIETLED